MSVAQNTPKNGIGNEIWVLVCFKASLLPLLHVYAAYLCQFTFIGKWPGATNSPLKLLRPHIAQLWHQRMCSHAGIASDLHLSAACTEHQ